MNRWIKKDLEFVWHPYTQLQDALTSPPILIKRARGIKLYDNQGNFYYDTISSWWCNVHGHNHPKIKAAIKKQLNSLEHVLFAGFTHEPAILLARQLISLSPGRLTKVFFSDNGSTAVEVALKISFQYWQNTGEVKKTKFVALDYGYHGDTIGAMSVSGIGLFNKVFSPLFFPSFKVPSPYCYRCPVYKEKNACDIDCITPLKNLLKEKSGIISAIILEPMVMAAGGMIVYPREYLLKVAKLAKEFRVHLILDEVATGFGRTGKMFACEYVNNTAPDFLCLSKGLTAGYLPLAATLTTDKIYKAFYGMGKYKALSQPLKLVGSLGQKPVSCADYRENKTFYHGHTYTANPLGCSAALASLALFKEEGTLNRIKKIMPLFRCGMEKFRDLPLVGDVRYIGLIGAIELVKDKLTKKSFGFQERMGLEVYKRALKRNLILRPLGNIIYLFLPLCIKRNELEDILEGTYAVIESLSRGQK